MYIFFYAYDIQYLLNVPKQGKKLLIYIYIFYEVG